MYVNNNYMLNFYIKGGHHYTAVCELSYMFFIFYEKLGVKHFNFASSVFPSGLISVPFIATNVKKSLVKY